VVALARVESVLDEHGFLEVTTLWISEAGGGADVGPRPELLSS
jgi:lysyl-tRNA synthetase class II